MTTSNNTLADILIHADWSVSPKKRWAASAVRGDGWTVTSVAPVGPTPAFVESLVKAGAARRVLAGFDFPIGLPRTYGDKTGETNFAAFLRVVGKGRWSRFADIARETSEVAVERPFYPAGSTGGVTQAALIAGHGETTFDALRRQCERATPTRRAACPIFWTLGGNQVGRGALSGWMEVVSLLRPLVPISGHSMAIWPNFSARPDWSSPRPTPPRLTATSVFASVTRRARRTRSTGRPRLRQSSPGQTTATLRSTLKSANGSTMGSAKNGQVRISSTPCSACWA